MAEYRCTVCEGEYIDPQPDSLRYFHSCAPVHNPAYDAQFIVDALGIRVPVGIVDPAILEMVEKPDKRDENVEVKPDGKVEPKTNSGGKEPIGGQVVKKVVALVLAFFVSFVTLAPLAHSQAVYNVCSTFSGTDVVITTTAETVVATSEACRMPGRPVKLIVRVYGVVTTGTGSATYQVRVRRDSLTGTVLGDAIAQTVLVAAGGTEPFEITVTDERAGNLNSVTYVATLEIASASGNSTVGQAYIEVMILG